MTTADLIWMNGEFVAWEDAKVHVLTHGLHYGTGVFEGIRAYETERGPAVFRHQEHLNRLEASAKLYYMDLPYAKEQLREVTHELIGRNGFKSCYIRPLVWRGYGPMGLNPLENPVEAMIAGSIGLLASASIGSDGPGLFEPVHGSAPDIAGTGKANPLAMFGSVALMLRHGLAMEDEAAALESAVDRALGDGLRTTDLGGDATTETAARAVVANL